MKRLMFSILFFVLMTSVASGQTWVTANAGSFSWDAVTQLSDGSTIPSGSTVEYAVYRVNASDTNKTNPVLATTVTTPSATITFTVEGSYFVGVKAVRKVSGTAVSESAIAWSDSAGATANAPFGFRYYLQPRAVTGLKP